MTDGALLIVTFATSGALEAFATARTEGSVRGLLDLAPDVATRVDATGGEHVVAAAELAVGDVIVVRPGERVGADGSVLDGTTEIDQATITGEPLPVDKRPGDEVFAGTLNGTGALTVRVDRPAGESVVARIAALVEEAAKTKATTQLFIEKVEQRYSIGMVAATLLLFVVPLLFGQPLTPTLRRAMTFMIVASPCAVVLATRHGVLVKSAVVMEQLGATTRVGFDKTGTLTEGTPPSSPRSTPCPVPTALAHWTSTPYSPPLRRRNTPASIPWPPRSSPPPRPAASPSPRLRRSPRHRARASPRPSTGTTSKSAALPICSPPPFPAPSGRGRSSPR